MKDFMDSDTLLMIVKQAEAAGYMRASEKLNKLEEEHDAALMAIHSLKSQIDELKEKIIFNEPLYSRRQLEEERGRYRDALIKLAQFEHYDADESIYWYEKLSAQYMATELAYAVKIAREALKGE